MRKWLFKLVRFIRETAALRVSLYASNASFFIFLGAFPTLLVLLRLLHLTRLDAVWLLQLIHQLLPEVFAQGAQDLVRSVYAGSQRSVFGISALITLWSAGRGMHYLLSGLDAVCGGQIRQSYLRRRLRGIGYTVAFFLVLLLTLVLHICGGFLAQRLAGLRILSGVIDLRFWLLFMVQTGVFAGMYALVPGRHTGFFAELPGALLAALVWHGFSDLYSVYVRHFARLGRVYGPVYGIPLAMLWLYCCISIVFWGGVLNRALQKRKK